MNRCLTSTCTCQAPWLTGLGCECRSYPTGQPDGLSSQAEATYWLVPAAVGLPLIAVTLRRHPLARAERRRAHPGAAA